MEGRLQIQLGRRMSAGQERGTRLVLQPSCTCVLRVNYGLKLQFKKLKIDEGS